MFHIKKLQTRFLICYLCVIIIPLFILSGIIYYQSNQFIHQKFLDAKQEALVSDKNYLDNKLDQMSSYYNQLTSCAGLSDILEGISNSERQVVYDYQSQILPQLNNVRNYDPCINSINIYTDNTMASRLLTEFFPLSDIPLNDNFNLTSINTKRELYNKFWKLRNIDNELEMVYYAGFMHSALSKISGILEINCSNEIFRTYAENSPNLATYIYYDDSLIYSFNDDEIMKTYLLANEVELLKLTKATYAALSKNSKLLISSFSLNNSNISVIRLNPISFKAIALQSLFPSMLLCLAVLVISSISIYQIIYKHFQNISGLSNHMSQIHNSKLTPYAGAIPDDEIGSLIHTYNDMVERTNTISEKLLHNELQLKNAQIEALQVQLNPHFFYGTLESIRMIAEANQQTLISDIAFSFGNLMHYSLSREYLVPVNREINIVKQYLSIQSKRLVNRFTINWDICSLDEKWKCPKFVLFNMVENVFSHNISLTRCQVNINISISQNENDLTITVTNSGPGISPNRLEQLRYLLDHPKERYSMASKNNGRSLFNINDRLQLFYGDNYDFSISSIENVTTTISIRLHKYLTGINI